MDSPTNEEVLNAMFAGMGEDERAILCGVPGDPSNARPGQWYGIPWRAGGVCRLHPRENNYVAISSFTQDDGKFKRRKDQFGAMYAVMIDDIGTKVDIGRVPLGEKFAPALVVETSPGNYQATFFLTEPLRDLRVAESGISQIIKHITGSGLDPGMAGVTRVLRLPVGVNGKAKYGGWSCKVKVWRPDVRVEWANVQRIFDMHHKMTTYVEPMDAVAIERQRGFNLVLEGLKSLGMVKRQGRGWIDIRCPWLHEHSDRADTGSSVNPPAKANGFYGGFKCHHGHCESRNWGDLENEVSRRVWVANKFAGDFFYDGTD